MNATVYIYYIRDNRYRYSCIHREVGRYAPRSFCAVDYNRRKRFRASDDYRRRFSPAADPLYAFVPRAIDDRIVVGCTPSHNVDCFAIRFCRARARVAQLQRFVARAFSYVVYSDRLRALSLSSLVCTNLARRSPLCSRDHETRVQRERAVAGVRMNMSRGGCRSSIANGGETDCVAAAGTEDRHGRSSNI